MYIIRERPRTPGGEEVDVTARRDDDDDAGGPQRVDGPGPRQIGVQQGPRAHRGAVPRRTGRLLDDVVRP